MMKKNILIVMMVITCMALATPASAAVFNGKVGTKEAVTTVIGGASFIPSTGVYVSVFSDDTAYCVTSVHASSLGNEAGRQYGSLSTEATIYSTVAPGTEIDKCTAVDKRPGSGWQ